MLNSSDGESTCSNKHLGTLSKGKPPQSSSKMFSFEGGYNSPDSNSRPDSFVKKSPGKSKISPGSKYGSSHSKNNHSIHSSPTNFKEQKQKAAADSERLHITFLAFRCCLRSLWE